MQLASTIPCSRAPQAIKPPIHPFRSSTIQCSNSNLTLCRLYVVSGYFQECVRENQPFLHGSGRAAFNRAQLPGSYDKVQIWMTPLAKNGFIKHIPQHKSSCDQSSAQPMESIAFTPVQELPPHFFCFCFVPFLSLDGLPLLPSPQRSTCESNARMSFR